MCLRASCVARIIYQSTSFPPSRTFHMIYRFYLPEFTRWSNRYQTHNTKKKSQMLKGNRTRLQLYPTTISSLLVNSNYDWSIQSFHLLSPPFTSLDPFALSSLSLSHFCVRYSLLFFLIFVDSITGPETLKEKVGIIPTQRRSAWLRSNLLKIYSPSWISSAKSLTMIHVDKIFFPFWFPRKVFINSGLYVCFFIFLRATP